MLEIRHTIITPGASCISAAELAAHLRLDGTLDAAATAELQGFIVAAEQAISAEIKRPLTVCAAVFTYPATAWDCCEISFDPLVEVIGVLVSGVAVDDYAVIGCGYFPLVTLASAPAHDADTIEITARVGYVTVPAALRVAVMQLAAELYEHRMMTFEGTLSDAPAYKFLLAGYRQQFAY